MLLFVEQLMAREVRCCGTADTHDNYSNPRCACVPRGNGLGVPYISKGAEKICKCALNTRYTHTCTYMRNGLTTCWELDILFHVNVADMPEHGTGHVGIFCLPTSWSKLTPIKSVHCNCASMCEHPCDFHLMFFSCSYAYVKH